MVYLGEYDKFLMWNLTWPEVEENLKTNNIVLISVGSTEQHGRHLPLSTDSAIGLEVCKRTLKKFYEATGQHALLAAEITVGMAKHHMDFPGSLSLEPETFINVLKDICFSLIHHGYKKIILVNSHGGNAIPLNLALREMKDETRGKKVFLCNVSQWVFDNKNWEEIRDAPPIAEGGDGHSGEIETSQMLALGQVRLDKIPKDAKMQTHFLTDFTRKYPGSVAVAQNIAEVSKDGYLGVKIETSTAEKGEGRFVRISDAFAEFLKLVEELKL